MEISEKAQFAKVAHHDLLEGFRDIPTGPKFNGRKPLNNLQISINLTTLGIASEAASLFPSGYVRLKINQSSKLLAVVGAHPNEVRARKLVPNRPSHYSSHTSFQIGNPGEALKDFKKLDNLNINSFNYRFEGELFTESGENILIYDLSQPSDKILRPRKK